LRSRREAAALGFGLLAVAFAISLAVARLHPRTVAVT
jgi:hypothetical protein